MIVIVGAGVIGTCSAYHLARAGYPVTVIDGGPAAAALCSRGNAGVIAVGHAESWAGPEAPRQMIRALMGREKSVKVSKLIDPALWRWGLSFLANCSAQMHRKNTDRMARLSRYSRACLKEMDQVLGYDYAQAHQGAYYLYQSAPQLQDRIEALTGDAAAQEAFTPQTAKALMDRDPALKSFGDRLAGGLLSSIDSKGDCRRFTKSLAQWLTDTHGVTFLYKTAAQGFERTADGEVSAVQTSAGAIPCKTVVLATGVDTPRLAKMLGGTPQIYPVKGYSGSYPIINASRIPALPFVDETDLVAVTNLGTHLRVTAIAEFAGHDRTVSAERSQYLDDYVAKNFAGAVDLSAVEHWAGLRPTTPSGAPYLGRFKGASNAWINAGHGQLGWTMAAGAGAVLADRIQGHSPALQDISQPAPWLIP